MAKSTGGAGRTASVGATVSSGGIGYDAASGMPVSVLAGATAKRPLSGAMPLGVDTWKAGSGTFEKSANGRSVVITKEGKRFSVRASGFTTDAEGRRSVDAPSLDSAIRNGEMWLLQGVLYPKAPPWGQIENMPIIRTKTPGIFG